MPPGIARVGNYRTELADDRATVGRGENFSSDSPCYPNESWPIVKIDRSASKISVARPSVRIWAGHLPLGIGKEGIGNCQKVVFPLEKNAYRTDDYIVKCPDLISIACVLLPKCIYMTCELKSPSILKQKYGMPSKTIPSGYIASKWRPILLTEKLVYKYWV